MSFRNLTPLANTALSYAQAGSVFTTKDWQPVIGHHGGHEATYAAQDYMEILVGENCFQRKTIEWSDPLNASSGITSDGSAWTVNLDVRLPAEIVVGDIVEISGTTNYNGRFKIAAIHVSYMLITITHTGNHATETVGTISTASFFRNEDSTTGTKYYPEIKYFASLKNMSYNTTSGALVELELSASSLTGDNLSKSTLYNPDGTSADYIHMYHGDEVFGKFDKVSIFKTAAAAQAGRLLLIRGPSSNLLT